MCDRNTPQQVCHGICHGATRPALVVYMYHGVHTTQVGTTKPLLRVHTTYTEASSDSRDSNTYGYHTWLPVIQAVCRSRGKPSLPHWNSRVCGPALNQVHAHHRSHPHWWTRQPPAGPMLRVQAHTATQQVLH